MINMIGIGILWLICGMVASGFSYGYFQRRYTVLHINGNGADSMLAMFLLISGPVGLLNIALTGTSYGWKTPFTKLKQWEWDEYTSECDKRLFSERRPVN